MEDVRIEKSKKRLKKALLRLLEHKKFDDITVSQICSEAKVNRMTFYNHYQSKMELYQDAVADLEGTIIYRYQIGVASSSVNTEGDNMFQLFKAYNEVLLENQNLEAQIEKSSERESLNKTLGDTFTKTLKKVINSLFKDKKVPVNSDFIVGGIQGMAHYYQQNAEEIDKNDYYDYAKKVIKKCYEN